MKTHHPSVQACANVSAGRGLGLIALSSLAGCGLGFDASTRDLGNTIDTPSLAEPDDEVAPRAADFFGTWVGEAEDPLASGPDDTPPIYRFPSGSSRFELSIDGEGGSIQFGQGTPPPLIDFDVGYPDDRAYWSLEVLGSPLLPPLEGFGYPLLVQATDDIRAVSSLADADVADGIIRLFYRQNDYLQDWCSGQRPQVSATGFSCLGIGAASWNGTTADSSCSVTRFQSDDEEFTPVDCDKLFLCEQSSLPICECDADACRSNSDTRAGLFLRRVGDELVGTVAQGVFARGDGSLITIGMIRFQRAE